MSFNNLSSIGHNGNYNSSNGGEKIYNDLFKGKEGSTISQTIDNLSGSNNIKALTFGLDSLLTASKAMLGSIESLGIFKCADFSATFKSFEIPPILFKNSKNNSKER